MQFLPSASGTGARIYTLTGTGVAPAQPKPQLAVALRLAESAPQGTISVTVNGPVATAGSGVVTLQFLPAVARASDPAIAFASGGLIASFSFAAGDIQATFGTGRTATFQTGTTADTIVFSAQAGIISDQQSVSIATVPVAGRSKPAVRQAAYKFQRPDSTTHAPPAACSSCFMIAGGDLIPPGDIAADTAAFAQYFSAPLYAANSCSKLLFP